MPIAVVRRENPVSAVQILMLMAGRGQRMKAGGHEEDKPYIPVGPGERMCQLAFRNVEDGLFPLGHLMSIRKFAVVEHSQTDKALSCLDPFQVEVIPTLPTEGAACTALKARPYLDRKLPLLISFVDEYIDNLQLGSMLLYCMQERLDACIPVFHATDPKWSFVEIGVGGLASRVVEKEVVSNMATIGKYWFREAGLFFDAAADMIAANDRTKNEFYIAPAFNYMIREGQRVGVYPVADGSMFGLGLPEDLEAFQAWRAAKKGTADASQTTPAE